MNKRGYFGQEHKSAYYGFAIVANTARQAKKILYELRYTQGEGGWNWIDLTIEWKRDAIVDHLPIGVIDDLRTGLESGIYTYIEDFECDNCDSVGQVQLYKGKILCGKCYDEADR